MWGSYLAWAAGPWGGPVAAASGTAWAIAYFAAVEVTVTVTSDIWEVGNAAEVL